MRANILRCLLVAIVAIQAVVSTSGAGAQMTPDQARQAALPHVQLPDTTLTPDYVVETSLGDRPGYLFYGDAWGSYHIDAVSGEKLIQHMPQSPLSPGDQPATTLPTAQLRQIAIDYVAAHFPNYAPGLFVVESGNVNSDDLNEFDVHFSCVAASGAVLPLECQVYVEEDVGAVKIYQERSIPVTISTVPAVSQAQAIAIAQTWIAQNLDPDPSWGTLMTPTEQYPIQFFVDVDVLMSQTLIYKIPCQGTVVTVDAQTGAVLSTDDWASIPEGHGRSRRKRCEPVEALWGIRIGRSIEQAHAAVALPGRVFLWSRQAEALGVAVRHESGKVTLTRNGRTLRLPLVRTSPGSRVAVWLRKGALYLPVAAVKRLTDGVHVDLAAHCVTLDSPYARLTKANSR